MADPNEMEAELARFERLEQESIKAQSIEIVPPPPHKEEESDGARVVAKKALGRGLHSYEYEHMANALLHVPLVSTFFGWFGFIPVAPKCLAEACASEHNVALVPGGIAEMTAFEGPHVEVIVLKRRLGFVRLALQHGRDSRRALVRQRREQRLGGVDDVEGALNFLRRQGHPLLHTCC